MKFAPPGGEPYRTLTRLDGFLGSDPTRIPNAAAREIAAALPPLERRTEIDRIRTRMTVRQLAYERKKRVRIAFRRRFGLLTR